MYRGRRNPRSSRRNYDGVGDLTSVMGCLSMGTATPVQVPLLSSYSFSGEAVVGKGVVVGEAVSPLGAIPENYSSHSAYLKDMKAHTQMEFEASVRQGADTASRREGSGWLPVTCQKNPKWSTNGLSFLIDGTPRADDKESGHDFKVEPWSRHVIQFEGKSVPALVVSCGDGPTINKAFLRLASAQGIDGGELPSRSPSLHTRVRSLGYVGSFLREYGSAAELLSGIRHSPLLDVVAAPGKQYRGHGVSSAGGTFVSADADSLDTTSVPLNATQQDAVLSLAGGLGIIVGPPGTGKSTTIWHIIDARVAPEARVLVTCTRNQAVDAVTDKVEAFGVLVFGSEARLGERAKECTMAGRMRSDPELVFWRRMYAAWTRFARETNKLSWSDLHLPNFPGFSRLHIVQQECGWTKQNHMLRGEEVQANRVHRRELTAGRWARVLEYALRTGWEVWLKNGSQEQRQTHGQMRRLKKYSELLSKGTGCVRSMLTRLENLTRFRIYTKTRVLICTVDSTERMVRTMEEGTHDAALAIGGPAQFTPTSLTIDTAIMDEAACVLETSVPVILALGVNNLILVGDHKQLPPFSAVRDGQGGTNHTRSLMERVIDAGAPKQFLTIQYRMHPRICEIVSKCSYENKIVTAEELRFSRKSPQPCTWVHVSGGEVKHKRNGYSNPREVPLVVKHARSALGRYGRNADIRVITFYNMQKRDLEREFKEHQDISHVRIATVDACQGSDADVIIISTVRSGGVGYQLSGFMLDPRRINVALSRAREECIIVGDEDTLRSGGGAIWCSIVSHFTS